MSVSHKSSSASTSESLKDSPCPSDQFFMHPPLSHEFSYPSDKPRLFRISKNMTQPLCCICAAAHLLISCQKKGCENSFHIHCLSTYFPGLFKDRICPEHSFKQLENCEKLINIANHFNSSTSLYETVKNEKASMREADVAGKFFWFGISQQYFQCVHLGKLQFYVDDSKKSENCAEVSWIDKKIAKKIRKIEAVTNSVESLIEIANIDKASDDKSEKVLDDIKNCAKTSVRNHEILEKNYETIQIKENKYELRDYHLVMSEEQIICAVCDDGISTAGNLIVICSNCNVAVHSACYNIETVPDGDWLCDVCQMLAHGSSCVLCPIKGGALKLAKPSHWVHVTCAKNLLNTETFFWDIRKINRQKFKLKCFSCEIQTGACLQCQFNRCKAAFHVECRKDLLESDSQILYCPQHRLAKLKHFLKQEEEASEKFIQKIADSLWRSEKIKRKFEELEKREKKRKNYSEVKLRRDYLLSKDDDKEDQYREDEGKIMKKCRRIRKLKDLMKSDVGEIKEEVDQEIRREKRKRDFEISENKEGELWVIRMKVPEEVLEEFKRNYKNSEKL